MYVVCDVSREKKKKTAHKLFIETNKSACTSCVRLVLRWYLSHTVSHTWNQIKEARMERTIIIDIIKHFYFCYCASASALT